MKKYNLIFALIMFISACKKTDNTTPTISTTTTTGSIDISALKDKFYSSPNFSSTVAVTVEGNFLVIRTNGIPDHRSPYYAKTDARYEAYNGTNSLFRAAPNTITVQNLTFKIQHLFFVSIMIVTGPSFTKPIFISAPNSPV